jgi:hypothetical protein
MDKRPDVKDADYEPPLDKQCGIMFVLETEEEVRRFVAAYGATGGGGWLLNHRPSRSLNHMRFQNDGI